MRANNPASRLFLSFCLLVALCPPLVAAATTSALVDDLTIRERDGQEAVIIALSRKPQNLHTFLLHGPDRLVLDISPASLSGAARNLPSGRSLFSGVRAAQFNPQTVRVVLDLTEPAQHRVETGPSSSSGDGHRIVVSLFMSDNAPGTASTGDMSGRNASGTAMARTSDEDTRPGTKGLNGKKTILLGEKQAEKDRDQEPSTWGDMDFSGSLMVKGTQEIHESGYPEQARSFRNTIRMQAKWTPPLPTLQAGGAEGADSTHLLASVQSDYLGFGPDPSDDDHDAELHEAYLSHAAQGWDLRLGRQIVRWGKTDQISPVDNLNPQDLREFVTPELEERKLPNWMARIRLFPGDTTVEGIFVPLFKENEFDFEGNTWALFGTEPSGLRFDEDEPGKGLGDSDYGLRVSRTFAGWDVSASYLHATEKSPHLRFDPFNPMGPTVHAEYRRQDIFGLEFETTAHKFGIRGEGAYFDRQSLPTDDIDSVSKPVLYYVLGVDYLGEDDWYANVQFSHQHVFEHESDILFLEQDNFFVNGEINREFWRGKAMLKLRYAVDVVDGGSFFIPETILTHFENLELSLGANLFFGPADSYFGRYRDNDQAFLKATYFF